MLVKDPKTTNITLGVVSFGGAVCIDELDVSSFFFF